VIEGLERTRFALLMKIHHSMIDGASGMQLAQHLFRLDETSLFAPASSPQPKPRPRGTELIRDDLAQLAARPLRLAEEAAKLARHPLRAAERVGEVVGGIAESFANALEPHTPTPLEGHTSAHRRVDWHWVPLDPLHPVRKAVGATVNDTALAIFAGGLRRFLMARGCDPSELRYRVCIPVDMRPPDDDFAQANHVSAFFVRLPLEERNPKRRLEMIREETRRAKQSRAAAGTEWMMQAGDWFGAPWVTRAGVELIRLASPFNLVATHVRGPSQPLYMLGAELESMLPLVPLMDGQGLSVAMLTLNGRLGYGLLADWDRVPDLAMLPELLEDSYDELTAIGVSQ
jgi:WS/DGAT/MGAT family acyltransferase